VGCNVNGHHPYDIIDDNNNGHAQLVKKYKRTISVKDHLDFYLRELVHGRLVSGAMVAEPVKYAG
jgi:hypothetical protein